MDHNNLDNKGNSLVGPHTYLVRIVVTLQRSPH